LFIQSPGSSINDPSSSATILQCDNLDFDYNLAPDEGKSIMHLGVTELFENEFSLTLSPVPASEYLEISYSQTTEGIKSLESYGIVIYNLMGQKVLSSKYFTRDNKNSTKLDISILQSGVYFVRQGTESGKFVKR